MISKKIFLLLFFVGPMMAIRTHAELTNFELKNVMIHGESNLSDFWLKYAGHIKLNLFENKIPADSSQTDQVFELPINEFDAQNNQIKRNFKQLVRADEFPSIFIQFKEEFCKSEEHIEKHKKGYVQIQIGGIKRLVEVQCQAEKVSKTERLYKGLASIKLTDFGLIPPNKFFGLVQVKDTILITFEVLVRSS
ncbi:MAG: YceI family protein [Bacteroidales bacterium]|nr:YceI family protein [Bacteroidales bacterium]